MVEPISLTAVAIATLALTKAFEKTVETLTDKGLEQVINKLSELLKSRNQDTARAIEMVKKNPELAQQQPENYGFPALIKKLEMAAKDPEIASAIKDVADAVKAQPQSIQSIVTEKIGVVASGSFFTGDFHFN